MANKKSKSVEKQQQQKQYKVAMSSDCERCKNKCERGINYLAKMVKGKAYKGVICRK